MVGPNMIAGCFAVYHVQQVRHLKTHISFLSFCKNRDFEAAFMQLDEYISLRQASDTWHCDKYGETVVCLCPLEVATLRSRFCYSICTATTMAARRICQIRRSLDIVAGCFCSAAVLLRHWSAGIAVCCRHTTGEQSCRSHSGRFGA